MYDDDLNIVVRLIIAVVLSGVLGWERESARKSAGLRTHILVGFSAALFVVLGEFMAADFRRFGEHVRFDGANLIGAVVTGISFLGAGMIIFQRGSRDIKGLTTAAGILATAAIGMLVGMQRYFLAAAGTAIVFVVLHIVHYFEPKQVIAGSEGSENDAEDNS